jgi:hypothetical protein
MPSRIRRWHSRPRRDSAGSERAVDAFQNTADTFQIVEIRGDNFNTRERDRYATLLIAYHGSYGRSGA